MSNLATLGVWLEVSGVSWRVGHAYHLDASTYLAQLGSSFQHGNSTARLSDGNSSHHAAYSSADNADVQSLVLHRESSRSNEQEDALQDTSRQKTSVRENGVRETGGSVVVGDATLSNLDVKVRLCCAAYRLVLNSEYSPVEQARERMESLS